MEYVDTIENKEIHITNTIKESYIYTLFYTKDDTRDFVETVEYQNPNAEFKKVLSFGNYKFEKIDEIQDGNVYVIKKEDRDNYNLENYKVTEFEKYIVVEQE